MGELTARLLQGLAATVRGGAQTYANYHAPPELPKRRGKKGCTPCAAFAAVDKAKQAAGVGPVE